MRRPLVRLALMAGIVVAAVACDQLTKHVARQSLPGAGTVSVVGDLLILRYAENAGGFLGLGADWHPVARAAIFGALSLAIVVAAAVYAIRHSDMSLVRSGLVALIVGGGLGNMIDRLSRGGRVTDFMNLGIGRVRTGVFNFADLFLMAGAVSLLLVLARSDRRIDRPGAAGDGASR